MVARISFPKRLLAALNYNENKCSKGNAECIAAVNYLKDANEMSFHQKHFMLERRNELNERATTKTIHVSLNFDPSERLSKEKLYMIADRYMKGIGFEEQPYLVYQHHDAGHPHLHIVSTTIREDGSRINTHNLGRNQSEKARKEIEEVFGLVRAQSTGSGKQRAQAENIKAIDVNKIIYGKTALKRSIANVVSNVFNNYKFSSLPEFNAALRQFNVVADRGKEDGRIFKNKGLVYRVMDEKGNKLGVPIKASLIACKPTLENLEKKFVSNKSTGFLAEEPMRMKNAINEAILSSKTIDELMNALKAKNIFTVLRQNAEGRIYGITFVDNEKKVVFNGSDLGRGYSAASLMKKLEKPGVHCVRPHADEVAKNTKDTQRPQSEERVSKYYSSPSIQTELKFDDESKNESLVEELMSAQMNKENIPFQLRKKKKKKKSKRKFIT